MGAQNQLKSGKRWKKGGPKIDAKNRCRKKAAKMLESIAPWSSEARFWGAGGFGGNGETGFDSDVL